jgi:hypothetical protein
MIKAARPGMYSATDVLQILVSLSKIPSTLGEVGINMLVCDY